MTTLLLAGATGLVGQAVLHQSLADARITRVVAPTRRILPMHPKLLNPQVDFSALPEDAPWWRVDAVICTLGTTIRDAGSQATFRTVDHGYPLAVARLARHQGARTYVLVSAMGANAQSRVFYSRIKGELERDLRAMGFTSLTFVRPGLLGGKREVPRPLESLGVGALGMLGPLLPRRYRMVAATHVASCLLHAALAGRPGVHVIESGQINRG